MCHMSCVTCHVWIFFYKVLKLVGGRFVKSMGPTPSSLKWLPNPDHLHPYGHTENYSKQENLISSVNRVNDHCGLIY